MMSSLQVCNSSKIYDLWQEQFFTLFMTAFEVLFQWVITISFGTEGEKMLLSHDQ